MSDIVEMLRTPTGCVAPSEWETAAADEIERLRRLIAWCRPRLSKDVYRRRLDSLLLNSPKNDGSVMTHGERK